MPAFDPSRVPGAIPDVPEAQYGAGDYARAVGEGALSDVGGSLAGGLRYAHEQLGNQNAADLARAVQDLFQTAGDQLHEGMSPEARKAAESTLTSDAFWEHPVLASSLKLSRMTPSMVALAIPGGLAADAIEASIMAGAAGGAVNAGAGVAEFYKQLDGMSDEDLKKQSPKYEALRELLDEHQARARFMREAEGWAPALNALIGAGATAIGPAGTAARKLAGGAGNVLGAGERGAVSAGVLGGAEGALGNAVQGGASDLLNQHADVEANFQKDLDYARAANAALEGGALGGLAGGVAGAVLHGRTSGSEEAKRPPKLPDLPGGDRSATADVSGPQPSVTSGRATQEPAKPVEAGEPNPQNAPTRSSRDGTKPAKGKRASGPPPLSPETAAPDVAAAMEATNPSDTSGKLDVNAIVDRLQGGPEAQPVPAEVTPPPVPQQPAPPEVSQALSNLERGSPADTGMNAPEQPAAIQAQQEQVGHGNRKAVMYPAGSDVPPKPKGLERVKTKRGTVDFDPAQLTKKQVIGAIAQGKENEILGLGPVSKPEVLARAAAGEPLGAVTERTPDGLEVKGALGTEATLPAQEAVLEANKTPGNTVQRENPAETVARRNATGGRILPNLRETAETTPLKPLSKADEKANAAAAENARAREEADFSARLQGKPGIGEEVEPEVVKGNNHTKAQKAALEERVAKADQIAADHLPADDEAHFERNPAARNRVIARARSMVARAQADGVQIPKQLRRSVEGKGAGDAPSLQLLRLAEDLTKLAETHKEGKKITDAVVRFKNDEAFVRAGFGDDMRAQRREEGDAKMNRRRQDEKSEGTVAADYAEEKPAEEVASEAPVPETKTVKEAEDTITTGTKTSNRPIALGDGTEEVNGVTRAKAATGDKLAADAEAKAKLIAEMNAKYGAPARPPTKNNGTTPEEWRRLTKVIADSKSSPEVEKTKAQIDAAMGRVKQSSEVEVNPSEAQKLAGNYKKGHRRVEGLDFTIENPKGSLRRGRGPDGKEWSVRMPADYGYFRRTVGADGDHIDAYDLRSGKRIFIADQLDDRTGDFDEHKVFTRAKDEAHVRDTYNRAFSDGKGPDRLGYLHEVTRPELHDWLNSGDTERSHLEHVLDDNSTFTPPSANQRVAKDTIVGPGGERVVTKRSEYLANELERFDFKRIPGMGGTLARFFQSRFQKIADATDTVVHYVAPEDMAKISNSPTALGLHWVAPDGTSHIALSTALKDEGVGHGSLAHVLLHETAHAVTVREIDNNPAARRTIERLMKVAADWMEHPDNAAHVEAVYGHLNSEGDVTRYAFTNAKEFIAEAFSNKGFQELLTFIPVEDPVMRDYLGLTRRSMSMWDVFRGYVKKAIEKITGKMPEFDSVLDSIMKVGETLEARHTRDFVNRSPEERRAYSQPRGGEHYVAEETDAFVRQATDKVKRLLEEANTSESAPIALKLRTFDNIAQLADHYFGEGNPVRKIYNAIEKMRVTAEGIFAKSEPLISKMVEQRAKNAEGFREFSSLLHDATVANVHPDVALTDAKNKHLGKARVVGDAVWAKAQHAALAARYRALTPELQELWHETTKHFRDTQNAMSLGIMENLIEKLTGAKDAALAQRVHDGTLTDADRARLGDHLDTLEGAGELSKIEGPYVPLIRRGDHVVKGTYKLSLPDGAKHVGDNGNEFEFANEKAATDYAKNSPLKATVKKVWVDEATGETHETDPATGETTKVSAKDLHAVARYRVEVQNRHVEFVNGRRAAEARARDLAADGTIDVHKVVPREFEVGGRQATELSASLQRLVAKLEKSEAYKQSTASQKAALRAAVEEAAAASHGSTRISSKALPRRGVAGYSEDLVRNTGEYGESSSRYLAKLEHGTELEAGMKQMEEQLKQDHSKTNQYGRTLIRNEVVRRVNGDNGYQEGGKFSPVVKRLMAISFIDKLASPAYSVINAMQPAMVTMPYLAGRHGVTQAVSALARAYRDIGAGGIVAEGARETLRRFKGKGDPDNFIANAKALLKSGDERRMIDFMVEHGVVDPSAGMEVRDLVKSYEGVGGKIDQGIGYLEGVTREMPRAVEAINRLVTALAAYRLERNKGASHEVAVQRAQDTVNNTQFNYAPTNSAPFMNHPLAKMAFQFKKYGQGMYQLIGGQIGRAYRNASPGDRAEAVKTLIALAGTHMAMAGALGLPTEPFKYLIMASGLVGGPQWADVEDKIRKAAADVLGKTGGEVFSRGLPRLLNLDLSRMGLDSVTSFGEPRSAKDADVKSWLFDTLGGPVAGLGFDWGKGLSLIANGDFEKAAEKMIPIKAASDTLRAYRQATEGKKKKDGTQSSAAYNWQETIQRAAGFGSGREAEEGAQTSSFYRQSQAAKDARSELMNAWVAAKPNEKAKAMAAITKWNQRQPEEARIKPAELTSKAKRTTTNAKSSSGGFVFSKRDQHLKRESPYNAD